MAPETLRLLKEQALPKGDVLTVAKVAGIMAAKRTCELIPLCHPLALTQVDLTLHRRGGAGRASTSSASPAPRIAPGWRWRPSSGASVAATTIYDMCKAVDRGMVIGDIRLLEKTGGKEDYVRPADDPAAAAPARPRTRAVAQPMPAVPPAGTVVAVNVSASQGRAQEGRLPRSCCGPSTASRATPTPAPGIAR